MTVNLYGHNHDFARFIELARRENPDVILLVEVDAAWSGALAALAADYPQRLVSVREDLFGIALLSRLPLLESRVVDLRGAPSIDARVGLADGRDLRLIGVHLRPPTSRARATERNAQLADLRARLAEDTGPLIVTGDFNVTPYSPLLETWLEQTGLKDARAGRGFHATWPAFFPILGIPIDHCLVSEHFTIGDQYQGAAFGSDHYPVLTRLFLRAG
jgi:endonuclease/exonuclease/phosphatase (EEP) superfamily protein YafD